MAYFNHAFTKTFLGTKNASKSVVPNANQSAGTVGVASGFIKGPAVYSTVNLIDGASTGANLGLGSYGFFDPKTWQSVSSSSVSPCCPLVLASTALYNKDGIGQPFQFNTFPGGASGNTHGGYQESNKSKVINPKYVSRMYRVDPAVPNQAVLNIGATPYTFAQGLDCCKEFLCDQAYSLRLDIKGSPALRYLDHNAYRESATWTGCCPSGALAPVAVDPTVVYIAWAKEFLRSPIVAPFIQITVYNQAGVPVGVANDIAAWDAYVPVAVVPCVPGQPTLGAGMVIVGAYVGTIFGDCTFYPTDFFEKQPVKLYASMVDYTGSVCDFTGVCVTEQCCPRQGNGFGDTVLKDLILSERYQQNDFYTGTDLRIREITQGYDVSSSVNRSAFYTRYVIQHNVPRFNNPTGTFDNDQYMLEVITNGTDTNLETFLSTWITSPTCGSCEGLEVQFNGAVCCVPTTLPFATAAVAYSFQFVVPGTGAWVFSGAVAIGASGLSLSASGAVTGAVPVAGVYSGTTTATDSYGIVVGCFNYTIVVV
jgi:hypothetical protein